MVCSPLTEACLWLLSSYATAMGKSEDFSADRLLAFHKAFSTGGPCEELVALLLNHLNRTVRSRLPRIATDILSDAVEDAILKYLRRPDIYDPNISRLDTFLTTVAVRCALDSLRRDARRKEIEQLILRDWRGWVDVEQDVQFRDVAQDVIRMVVRTREERRFVDARSLGECRTEVLASLIGFSNCATHEQRAAVKRMNERLRMRAKRFAKVAV